MPSGEFVRIELLANGLNIADRPTLFDGNGEVRTLGGGERLNIIFLRVEFDSANPAKTLTIFDDGGDGGLVDNLIGVNEPIYFVSGVGSSHSTFSGDGLACGIGRIPNVISTNGVGPSGVEITGIGHITQG